MKKHIVALIIAAVFTLTNLACATNLAVAISGNQVVLSWPSSATNDFYLQYTTNLSTSGGWSNAADPVTNGTSLVVTDSFQPVSRFYRLQAWRVIFDGTNISDLRAYPTNAAGSFPTNSWLVTNGMLETKVVASPTDIITKTAYTNFELRWLWKTDTNGNSGVFYRAPGSSGRMETTSPEFQLLDDANRTNASPYTGQKNQMGAVYGILAPTNRVLAPTGQWNDCRVIAIGHNVQHWLNGNLILDYAVNTSAWTNALAASTYSADVNLGQATNSYIGFQNIGNDDNGVTPGATYFQDIKIRPLP